MSDQKREDQIRSIYEVIGYYCVKFQHLEQLMKDCIVSALDHGSYETQKSLYTFMKNNNGRKLLDNLRDIIHQIYASDTESLQKINAILGKVSSQIDYRNDTIHPFMFIDYLDEDISDKSEIEKLSVTRNGLTFSKTTISEIRNNAEILIVINTMLGRLRACISFRDLKPSDNLSLPSNW